MVTRLIGRIIKNRGLFIQCLSAKRLMVTRLLRRTEQLLFAILHSFANENNIKKMISLLSKRVRLEGSGKASVGHNMYFLYHIFGRNPICCQ